MIHFLRNDKNKTIIECEVYGNDLHASTNIENYSSMLLELYKKGQYESFILTISALDEIRGWWWEQAMDNEAYGSIDDFVKEKFVAVANIYGLNYVTD